jgi:hypothetical protein
VADQGLQAVPCLRGANQSSFLEMCQEALPPDKITSM